MIFGLVVWGIFAVIFPTSIYLGWKVGMFEIHEWTAQNIGFHIKVRYYQRSTRSQTIDLIRGCNGDESCIFWEIYDFLDDFEYIPSELGIIYPPLETIKNRGGDCKNLAVTACAMLRSVGQDCDWSINKINDEGAMHMVGLTYLGDDLMAFDLTVPTVMPVETVDDYWNEWWT